METCFDLMERREHTMKKEKKEPRGYYVEKGSFFVHASVIILVLSMIFRLLGTMNYWNDMFRLATQVALPVVCAVLFILFILLLGRVALWTTILPVLGGAAFFILEATGGHEQLRMILCIVLAFFASFIYTATLAGMIRTKWMNVIVFLGILVYQGIFIAYPVFTNQDTPVSFVNGMALLSSIGIVFAMLCASLAIRRRKPAKAEEELPKIKDPKVVTPERTEETPLPDNGGAAAETVPPVQEEVILPDAAESADLPAADPDSALPLPTEEAAQQ